ncbi:Uncharacterized protein K02A2.6 [Stylophora pistillata]|uniref:Uncharacterized protein K02A2.6 n=1 Tax=Stylophora pistillata TaxID=50429 RepID=A0A2B4R857_STYPI|nr:Uncharacterized protein K02A2.6 [Stylophora pistillata]
MEKRFGFGGIALKWFKSYLEHRVQSVKIKHSISKPRHISYGVVQGLVLGPLLFLMYTSLTEDIVAEHGLNCIMYADDSQLYIKINSSDRMPGMERLISCVNKIMEWAKKNRLQCNPSKTEIIHFLSRFSKNPPFRNINIGDDIINLSNTVRDIGVMLDSVMNLRPLINSICKSSSLAIRNIGRVHKYLSTQQSERLIHAFISSRLDHCNSLLYGLPICDIEKFQRIRNTAARLLVGAKSRDSITPILMKLHWLPVTKRIQFKMLLIAYKALNDMAPTYLVELLSRYIPARNLRSSNMNLLEVPTIRTKTEKCQFGLEQIEFFGQVFTKDGLKPSADKVTAVKECGVPESKEVKAKIPPRIEKWIMEMQHMDYELVYEPGKDKADPLDFLSRHPLPETGRDETEKIIKWNVNTEHAVVITRIREDTQKDEIMQRLTKRIAKGDWEKHKRDKDVEPYQHVKQELSVAEGPIFREHRIVLPPAPQRKVCYECQVATKGDKEEPIKVTSISNRPWDTVSIDNGGPYLDGHYNLVLIDKRTRYPVVESVPSTDFQTNKERLKHIFATYGTLRRIERENGPPFNSKEFNEPAKQEGFQPHRVTPLHPRANGEVERFMQTLSKTEQIANLQGKNRLERRDTVQDMLIAYRSTPHPAMGVAPYEALKGTTMRTKLDYIGPKQRRNERDDIINRRDAEYKQNMKQQREGRKTRENNLPLGGYVLIKQPGKNRWSTPYEPVFYIVYNICGSQIKARHVTD